MELSQYTLPNDRGSRSFYHEQVDALQSCIIGTSKVQTLSQNDQSSDRFLLKIPYCARQLQWDLFFDSSSPSTPPDFIFEEGFETFISLTQVKSLSKWNPKDKDSLSGVILELLSLWKEYQKTLFSQTSNDRLQFEFNTLESEKQGVEYLVYGPDEYRCFIPLTFDFVKIEPCPRLLVQFTSNSAETPETRLVPPPNSFWEYLLQGTKLPAWNKDTCTVEYIRTLTEQVKTSFDAFQHRKKYIENLKLLFGSCLEYDGYAYQKISFLFEHNTFTFLLLVSLTSEFPTKQPVLTIQASTLSKAGNLVTVVYDNYPYSPRWLPDEMARRAREFLVKSFEEIKQKCTELVDK